MSSRSPVSSTWANRVLGSNAPRAGGGCRPAAGASPLAEADPVGEVSGGTRAELLGAAEELAPVEPIGDSADGSVEPGADCPPALAGLPITMTAPAGRSVWPPTVTEPATGLLADTRRSGCVPWLMTCISTGAVPPARYTAAVCAPAAVFGKAICASR